MFNVDCSKVEKLDGIVVMWEMVNDLPSNVKMLPTSDYMCLLSEDRETYTEKFGDVQEAIEWILENLPSVCK